MLNAEIFIQALTNDNRAYFLYDVVYNEEGDKISVGKQVRVLQVLQDDSFSSGYCVVVNIKKKQYKFDRLLVMPRIQWLQLVKGIHRLMLERTFPDQTKKKSSTSNEKTSGD